MQSRRYLLVKGIGVAAVAVATPSLLLASRPEDVPALREARQPAFDGTGSHLSNAVAEGVFSSFSALIANHNDRSNVLVAAHAWRVAKDHFDETGFMRRSDQIIREAGVNEALTSLVIEVAYC